MEPVPGNALFIEMDIDRPEFGIEIFHGKGFLRVVIS
jgi:hypothetical protein